MKTKYYKYPRTMHFLWSENLQNDDRLLPNIEGFENRRVIVSEKMDGENSSMNNNYCWARSINSSDHPSRHYVKRLHAQIKHKIPEGWRICGENCYALHSIYYIELHSYFFVFGVYDENNECLSWEDTLDFCGEICLTTHVPVLYDGIWDEEKIKSCYTGVSKCNGWTPKIDVDFKDFRKMILERKNIRNFAEPTQEGYVVRIADSFHYNDHQKYCAKFVKKSHVRTSDHWMTQQIIANAVGSGLYSRE